MAQRTRRQKRFIWAAVILGLVALFAVVALVVTSQPQFCRSCHLMETRYVSWERSDHYPQADCLDCHAEPGVIGEIKAHLNGVRYLYVLVTGRPEVILRARVPEGTCVQCHPLADIEDETGGVPVDHRGHASSDIPCETCHGGFHDEIEGGSLQGSLEVCSDCHGPSTVLRNRESEEPARPAPDGWSVDGVQ